MDRLWAPWRMKYIKGEDMGRPEGSAAECALCGLQESEDGPENLILFRGARTFVILNRFPYTNGHVMIVPSRHVRDFEMLDSEEGSEIFRLAQRSVAVLREKLDAQGFNMGMNLGTMAGAGIDSHLHLHIVPRWEGDTNFMPVVGEVRVIPELLAETYEALLAAFR